MNYENGNEKSEDITFYSPSGLITRESGRIVIQNVDDMFSAEVKRSLHHLSSIYG